MRTSKAGKARAEITLRDPDTSVRHAKMLALLQQFQLIFNSARRQHQTVQSKTGLGGAQLWALSIIGSRPGINVGDLARELSINPSTASNLIRDLTSFGAVSKKRLEDDQRSVQLEITAKGKTVLRRVSAPLANIAEQATLQFSGAELNTLESQLEKLLNLAAAGDKSGKRKPLTDL